MSIRKIICCTSIALVLTATALGQPPPPVACSIQGTNPANTGYIYTYILAGSCGTVNNWTTSNGSIQSQNSTSVTIWFNQTGHSKDTIKALYNSTTIASVTINLNPAAALTGGTISNPTQTINWDATPSQINASVSTGGLCNGSYTYEWYSSPDSINYTVISGANGQNYQPPALTSTTFYKREVLCDGYTAYTTNVAKVTVNPQPLTEAGSGPTFQETNSYTQEPMTLMAAYPLSGTCNSDTCFTLQWQSSPNQTTWTNISGANDLSYNPGEGQPTATTYYRLQVQQTGSNPQTVYSNVDTVQVENVVIGGPTECWVGQTVTYYYYYGSPISSYVWNPSTGCTIIGPYTGVATLTVQWTQQQSGLQPINLTYTGHNYTLYVDVKNYPLIPGRIDIPNILTETDSSVSLGTSPVSGGSCLANFAYQWQQSTDSVNYTNISGQTSSTLTITPTQNTYYRRQITCGTAAYSDTCCVRLYPHFYPGTISTTVTDSIGWNTAPPEITGDSAYGGFDTTYSYQWYYST